MRKHSPAPVTNAIPLISRAMLRFGWEDWGNCCTKVCMNYDKSVGLYQVINEILDFAALDNCLLCGQHLFYLSHPERPTLQ